MSKKLFHIWLLSGILTLAGSCVRDVLPNEETGGHEQEEQPVEFIFVLPEEEPGTRAALNARNFQNGDVVHIVGRFTLDERAAGEEKTEIRYGVLQLNTTVTPNKWEAVDGGSTALTWPNTAKSGTFEAYYIPGMDGVLQAGAAPHEFLLSGIKVDNGTRKSDDPLHAQSEENIGYGKAVKFPFRHLLTYLALEDIFPIVSQQFYFTTDKLRPTADAGEMHDFHNAFQFSLNTDNTLHFEFSRTLSVDPGNEQLGSHAEYIIPAATTVNADNTGSAGFFLEPGYYEHFTLKYPATEGETTYTFLNFKYAELPEDTEDEEVPAQKNTPPQLDAGVAYTLKTRNAPGVTIDQTGKEEEKKWDESDDFEGDIDVDTFLTAIRNNEEYWLSDTDGQNRKAIITKNGQGHLELQCNVDFGFAEYVLLENGSEPDVPANVTFDGGLHYIRHLGSPLFAHNRGTILNLGIKEVHARVALNQHDGQYKIDGKDSDQSRKGGLCNQNLGTIRNIRMANVTMEATVISESEDDVENIGCILGSNYQGSIAQVRLSGTFSLTLRNDNEDTDGINCTMNIGGLVGQNAGGTISDIAALYDEKVPAYDGNYSVSVTNLCTSGLGAYYIGGAVGFNENYIGSVSIPQVTVDASSSICTKSFIGLLTGETTTSAGSPASVVSCNAVGSLTGGIVVQYQDLDSGSYIGGIAGAILRPDKSPEIYVSDCIVIASSLDNSRADARNIINATGGCFGRIYNPFHVEGITLRLDKMRVPGGTDVPVNLFHGSFAGLAVEGQTWEDYADRHIQITGNAGESKQIGGNKLI